MQKIKSVEDLGTASYVLMHNYKLAGRRGREVLFDIEEEKNEEKFDEICLDYLSSEFHRFDSCVMSLKKIREYNFNETGNTRFATDLGVAAYILMHKYKVLGKKGKYIYFEVESDNKFDELAFEYLTSDFHRFDSCLMSLKKINEYISDKV
jgi:hypothetical protein